MTDEDITQKQILSDSIRRRYAYLKRRRKVRAMRIFWGRVRMLIRLACIYFLCVGIWKFMHLPQWYLPPKAFDTYNSSRVEFEGNKIATNQQILNMMKRVKYPNKAIYLIDVEPFKKRNNETRTYQNGLCQKVCFPCTHKSHRGRT